MTPVREALEAARAHLITLGGDPRSVIAEFGSPSGDEIQAAILDVIDAAIASLSAAPGEPCARIVVTPTRAIVTENSLPQGEHWVYTTPQPAAGWDDIVDLAKDLVALWESPRIQGLARSDRNAAIEDTRNAMIEAVHKLARSSAGSEQGSSNSKVEGSNPSAPTNNATEAPAPAEGVTDTSTVEDAVTSMIFDVMYDKVVVKASDCRIAAKNLLSSGIIAPQQSRPDMDTAEARLREALDLETIQTLLDLLNPLHGSLDEQTYDDKLRENFDAPADAEYGVNITARMERDLTQAVLILEDRKRQALSPPSGGDGAKESEGGGPKSRTYVRQLVDDPNSASGKSLQNVEVSPSEPFPPADRREIVARIIDPHAFIIVNSKRADTQDRQAAANGKADAILAALASGPEGGSVKMERK